MNFSDAAETNTNRGLEMFIVTELIRLVEDANSAVKFNAESSLSRLFKLNSESPVLPTAEDFTKVAETLSGLSARIKQKFKTRSLDDPEDIDISCINL